MEYGETYNPEIWQFDWNQQKATGTCVCGRIVEVMSDGPTECECHRLYWLETSMKVDWAHTGGDPDQLLG